MEESKKQPTLEEIDRRAYELWEARGRPEGGALQDWLQAQRELMGIGEENAAMDVVPPEQRGCAKSFILEEHEEFNPECNVKPNPKEEYVQPDKEREAGGEDG